MKMIHSVVGPVHTNCYIVYDEKSKEAIIIDPGEKAGLLLENIKEHDLKLKYILLTHGHFDHIIAVPQIKAVTGAKLVVHKKEEKFISNEYVMKNYGRYIKTEYTTPEVDILAKDGTEIEFGDLKAKYIHTPGHTKGSCIIEINDSLFTGDTLFAGECGRCDLEGGDFSEMLVSLKKIAEIDGDYNVYPGHENFSTLETERKRNKYMLQATQI
ncbi:MAG: MBL fold metallo-hydrolase [Clostridia bacterium]